MSWLSIKAALDSDPELFLREFLDERVSPPAGRIAKEVGLIVTTALVCIQVNPETRPDMRSITQELAPHNQITRNHREHIKV